MEISSSLPMTETETDALIGCCSQEAEELHYPGAHGVQEPITDEQDGAEAEEGKTDGEESLLFEIEGEEKEGEERGESEGAQDIRGGGGGGGGEEQNEGDGERGETEGEDRERGEKEREDGERGETKREDGERGEKEREGGERGETERKDGERGETKREDGERENGKREETERGEKEREDGERGETEREDGEKEDGEREEKEREDRKREETEREDGKRGATKREDGERGEKEREDGKRAEKEREDGERGEKEREDGKRAEKEREDGERGEKEREDGKRAEKEREDGERGETEREIVEDGEQRVSSGLFLSSDSLPGQQQVDGSNPSDQSAAAMLDETWLGLGCRNQGNRDDLSDCLQAELAIVCSDSDAGEDQWAGSAPCDVTNQEETSGGIQDGIRDGERKEDEGERRGEREEEGEREDEAEIGIEHQKEEDEEERRRDRDDDVSSSASSTDPDRRVPADFCIHQQTRSENIFTEHLDFLLARQQWRKMEEEVKGQPLPQPGARAQRSFQGTHSALYPPTRSPRLKHREVHPQLKESPLSSTLSPSSEDSGLDDSSYRSPLEEPESPVEREIRLTLEREERHRRERGMVAQGLTIPRPTSLQTGRSPPRPPACRTPTLSISPSPSPSLSSLSRSVYHEMTANNVIILEPDSSHSASRTRLLSPGGFCDRQGGLDGMPPTNVVVVETSNLIIRSASEFCLSSAPVSMETQESTFSSNPFFKLRSLSSQSLVEQEIRMVRQREEDWRRQREEEWRMRREEEWRKGRERDRYDTVLVSPGLNDNISYNASDVPDRCVSSPSSPTRTRRMERSSLSCDHKWFR